MAGAATVIADNHIIPSERKTQDSGPTNTNTAEASSPQRAPKAAAQETHQTSVAGTEAKTKDGIPVWLHVYDLGPMSKYILNSWASHIGNLGAFHVGIEVLDLEWCFQAICNCTDLARSGINFHSPKKHPHHCFRQSVFLGYTQLGKGQIQKLLLEQDKCWPASSYHFVRRNCVDFAEHIHKALETPEPFPAWARGCSKGWLQSTPLARADNMDFFSSMMSCGSSGEASMCNSSMMMPLTAKDVQAKTASRQQCSVPQEQAAQRRTTVKVA